MARLSMATNTVPKNNPEIVTPTLVIHCVFISEPFPECYCMNINSTKIPKVLKYCAGDYTLCSIYIRKR